VHHSLTATKQSVVWNCSGRNHRVSTPTANGHLDPEMPGEFVAVDMPGRAELW
jgi:hypothetical protein